MITKHFCDCGKELIFTQKDSCMAPWYSCDCGKQYYKAFCDDCGATSVYEFHQEINDQCHKPHESAISCEEK
jgi:hypothetical protein